MDKFKTAFTGLLFLSMGPTVGCGLVRTVPNGYYADPIPRGADVVYETKQYGRPLRVKEIIIHKK